MNYLAHLYLSHHDVGLLVGNFIGDHVANKDLAVLPQSICSGVEMHRAIDQFTDTHPITRQLRSSLFDDYRHRSRVIVDLFYDHFLAKHWNIFSAMPLPEYALHCYKVLKSFEEYLPESSSRYLEAMHRYRWLEAYQTIDGLESILILMSQRTRYSSNLETGGKMLLDQYSLYENYFFEFFPDLKNHVSLTIESYA